MTTQRDINVSKPVCLWAGSGVIAVAVLLMIWLINPPCEPSDIQARFLSASCAGDLTQVRSLLRDDRDLSAADLVLGLRLAAMYGHEAVVDELLSSGVNIDARDSNGTTPLFCAVLPCDGTERIARRL